MIAAPTKGFVFLAMSKCASTSIEAAFSTFAQVTTGGTPQYKHLDYRAFDRHIAPLLASRGHDRNSYEVVCLFRHPVEWLESWYRYRSREGLARPSHRNHAQYAGQLTFDEFAEAYMKRTPPARLRRPSRFISGPDGQIGVDRIYRLDDLDDLVAYLNERVGRNVVPPMKNASPPRETPLTDAMRSRLEAHMADEMDIYLHRTVGH